MKILRSYTFLLVVICFTLLIPKFGYSQFPNISKGNIKPVYDNVDPVIDYNDLMKVDIPNTTIESVTLDKSGNFCTVIGIVNHPPSDDRVTVYIALPIKNWNGRFYGTGGAGYMGGHPLLLRDPVNLGFAAGATDAGHDNGASRGTLNFSASFALDSINHCLNWQEIRDYGYLGVHDMTVVGKALVEAYYGKPARYTYFVGGSNGGRQGVTEAQRYPEDYDGILSFYPAINLTKVFMGGLWPHAVMNDAKHVVSVEKQVAITKAAVEACDDIDGVVDGVIDAPGYCNWNPANFVGTKVGDEIFNEADADVIRRIWEGPRTHDGKFLWWGMPRGSSIPDIGTVPLNPTFYEWPKYFIKLDPNWNISELTIADYELMWNQSMEEFNGVFYAENPDLSSFRDHGSKLLILHGLADQLIPHQGSIKYFESVQRQMGEETTSDFIRLFLVPGTDHYVRGAGHKPLYTVDALMNWVENNTAPDTINAAIQNASGEFISTRPIFSYPNMARYSGKGNTNEAKNYIEITPTR